MDLYGYALVQKGQFPQPLSQEVEIVVKLIEDFRIRYEGGCGATVTDFTIAGDFILGNASTVFLRVEPAFAPAFDSQPGGKG